MPDLRVSAVSVSVNVIIGVNCPASWDHDTRPVIQHRAGRCNSGLASTFKWPKLAPIISPSVVSLDLAGTDWLAVRLADSLLSIVISSISCRDARARTRRSMLYPTGDENVFTPP